MRLSQLFTKTLKQPPKDEVSISSKYLIQAGFVDKLMAGVYSYLPLGFLVLKNIERIIREEMLAIGAQEIFMPSLTPKEIWEKTGRWEIFTDLYKFKDAGNKDFALAATHEEVIVPLVKKYIKSYKDLPCGIFQIQNKFRSELRVKSGLIRGREFLMKDLYSFHQDEDDLNNYYDQVINTYQKIFKRVGIDQQTVLTIASGGTFSKFSHEFQTISSAGEDLIYLCEKCKVAINKEIVNEQKKCSICNGKNLKAKKSIEVGNIFKLMDKYTKPFSLFYQNEKGQNKLILMGSYGLGLSRLMATIIEINHDKNGMIWPKAVSPFQIHLIDLDNNKLSEELYNKLKDQGFTVIFDDRDLSAGEKFKDADLLGIRVRLISSKRLKDKLEIKFRDEAKIKINNLANVINELKHYYYNV